MQINFFVLTNIAIGEIYAAAAINTMYNQ